MINKISIIGGDLRLVKLSEAPSHGKPIHVYDKDSKGTLAYLNLAKEVIERNGY